MMKDVEPKSFSPANEADPEFWKAKHRILRAAVYKFLAADGNDMCHENRVELGRAAGFGDVDDVRPLPFIRFMWNCIKYRINLGQKCGNCGDN